MRSAWLLPALLCIPICPAFGQAPSASPAAEGSHTIERTFASGGRVNMKLSAGEYMVRASAPDGKILIRWTTKKPEQAKKVSVSAEVKGPECDIVTRGPRDSFRVEIELPARADLHVRLNAGDFNVRGIEGSKDIECHAGDVTIDLGRADDYGAVDASVRIGDFEAPPLGASKGGFIRKFKWQGPGRYALHAHVGVGSLSFLGTPSGSRQSMK